MKMKETCTYKWNAKYENDFFLNYRICPTVLDKICRFLLVIRGWIFKANGIIQVSTVVSFKPCETLLFDGLSHVSPLQYVGLVWR